MDSATRDAIRRARDAAARLGLRPVEGGCTTCGTDLDDWTLGCRTCSERHRAYDKRLHYPNGERWYREMREAHKQYFIQERRGSNGSARLA